MGHPSTPHFRSFHALRIKGFATVDTVAEIAALDTPTVESHLEEFSSAGHAMFREKRSLWQMTPEGRQEHTSRLAADLDGLDASATFEETYPEFVTVNLEFKELCGSWQLRGEEPNDHTDADYDGEVLDRLRQMHERARPLVGDMGSRMDRMAPYAGRLDVALARVLDGDTNLFTGVMCNSYHDVWMELHEDLILTQGINREAEGSF